MNFDDLKERIMASLKSSWDNFQESNLYFQLKDRYENLTPPMQKLTVVGIVALLIFTFLSIPWGTYQTSQDSVLAYEGKRLLIRDLLKTSRDAGERPNVESAPDPSTLQSQIQSRLQAANLLPEQIKGIEAASEKSELVPEENIAAQVKISLATLNLRQVIDLGYQIQSINSSVKMKDLVIEASHTAKDYFDVVYHVVVLNVPDFTDTTPANEETKPPTTGGRKKPAPKGDE